METEDAKQKLKSTKSYSNFLIGCITGLIKAIADCETLDDAKKIAIVFEQTLESLK